MTNRDPITCHVLDTTTGRPGANISVTLCCLSLPDIAFTSTTNVDGRITNWVNSQVSVLSGGTYLRYIIRDFAEKDGTLSCPKDSSLWKLKFNTGAYYGLERTFFPVVELTFVVKEGEHFHVPLLLGPYSFTTYRGS